LESWAESSLDRAGIILIELMRKGLSLANLYRSRGLAENVAFIGGADIARGFNTRSGGRAHTGSLGNEWLESL